MRTANLTTVPTSWLLSILAVFIATAVVSKPHLPSAARIFFGLGLGLIAVVAGFVGLRSEYGVGVLGKLQPHLAILMAPMLWLGFQSLASSTGAPTRKKLMLAAVSLMVAELALFVPTAWSADVVVIAINTVYVVLLAAMLRKPQDAFVQVAPHRFRTTRIALLSALLFMALIVAADITILLAMLSAGNAGVIHVLTGASGVVAAVVMLCALIGVPLFLGAQPHGVSGVSAAQVPVEEDHDLLCRLDQMMVDHQIFTDPDLTLARLGRRLHCPARSVSKAINLVHKENVSRYINGFRVRHVAMLLKTTDRPVTDIMLESGFQSKSSFNAEFRRLTGQTPSSYSKHGDFDDIVLNRDLKRSDS